MKWFDIDLSTKTVFLQLRHYFKWWLRIPDKKTRFRLHKESLVEARAMLDEARRREKWLAKYEGRKVRDDNKLADEIIEQLRQNRTS